MFALNKIVLFMFKIRIVGILLAFTLGILSCENSGSNNASSDKTVAARFFDLKGFLKTEIATYLKPMAKIRKTVVVNGKSETQELSIADWEKELTLFFSSDINRPAWQDKYMVKENAEKNLQEYYAQADNLKTRYLIADMRTPENPKLQVLNAEKTGVTSFETQLSYEKKRGFQLKTFQKMLGTTDSVSISIDFL
jgi:hypothetical protein